jgi:hypothetical protein
MPYTDRDRPVAAVLADLLNQLTSLVGKEGQLARAEMSETFAEVGVGLGLLAGAAILLIPALVILLEAAVAGLATTGLFVGWAGLAVGGAVIVIGLTLFAVGIARLKRGSVLPRKTIGQLQRDVAVATWEARKADGIGERAA